MTVERPIRGAKRPLDPERPGEIVKVSLTGFEAHVVVNTYTDGTPAEVFIRSGLEGSTWSGFLRIICKLISVGLKYGVPVGAIVYALEDEGFEPSGWGTVGDGPTTRYRSIADALGQVLSRYTERDSGGSS